MKGDFAEGKAGGGALATGLPNVSAPRVADNHASFAACGKAKVLPRDDRGRRDAKDFDVRVGECKTLRERNRGADAGEGTGADGEEDGGEG